MENTWQLTREKFPKDFVFGCATSAYQIEGNTDNQCGTSIWDSFSRSGGSCDGSDGSVACDHIRYWREDLDLLADAGFDAYRFSFAWPRIMPQGRGNPSTMGLSFYDQLLDGILNRGMKPFATLYHWDLPQSLEERGGWQNRDTAKWFADYTDTVMHHLGDRLHHIATINEPWCAGWLGHYHGVHAPGIRSLTATAHACHHIMLAHGEATEVIRAYSDKKAVGIVINLERIMAADDTSQTSIATKRYESTLNEWFLHALFKGHYPSQGLALLEQHLPHGYEADLKRVSAPQDWLGINYYTMKRIKHNPSDPHMIGEEEATSGEKTSMGWLVHPQGLEDVLKMVAKTYTGDLPLYVTENGMASHDSVVNGEVSDHQRTAFFERHLKATLAAQRQGVPVRGYFAWSLLDNFEWAYGYTERFGIVHVDYTTQQRTPKHSWHQFKEFLTEN